MLRDFQFDLLSFALGFAAATLIWWLVSRFRPLLPEMWAKIKSDIQKNRQRSLEGVDGLLRKDALRRAQKEHLAASLFALDEVLIAPRLLAPPPHTDPDKPPAHESIAAQVIPYLPEWPELAAGHRSATISLSDALKKGCNIAVLGQPGSGKTVMLASLASMLARRDPGLGILSEYIPLYLHIHSLQKTLPEDRDPTPALLKAVGQNISTIYHKQLGKLILDRLQNGNALLILDGLDELHPSEMVPAVEYLAALLNKYPALQIAASISPYHFPGLGVLKLTPLGIAAWGAAQREEHLLRWNHLWNTYLVPEMEKQHFNSVPSLLIDNWLRSERGFPSPLEWTLVVWGAYAGELHPAPFAALQTFFSRFSHGLASANTLDVLAYEFLNRGQSAIPYPDLAKFLTSLAPSAAVFIEPDASAANKNVSEPATQKPAKKDKRDLLLSFGEQVLEKLVKGGVLVERQGSLVSFLHPVFGGYLAGREGRPETITTALREPYWTYANQALRYAANCSEEPAWIETFLSGESTPLCRPLLAASRWLMEGKPKTTWRSSIFRQLLEGLQNESLPLSMRARMVAAFVASNDDTVPKLFIQLCAAPSHSVRLLVALGLGAWADPRLASDLVTLLGDENEHVRSAACLGLVALHSEDSLKAVADILMEGDENMRQAAAESLAFLPGQGGEIIQEAVKSSDLLTRRAAVFGLLQIHEPWSKTLLENIAVEDGQWVVRNAAAQALETIGERDARIPTLLPKPHESPWLTAFAGIRNLGLSPTQPATDVLLMALKSGTLEDQIEALRYLRNMPEEKVIAAMLEHVNSEQPTIQEAALLVIWGWLLAGVKLPARAPTFQV